MASDTKVRVYFGPLSWFEEQLGKGSRRYLLDAVNERDEARRRIRHTVDGQESTEEEAPALRPDRLIAMFSDYPSVHEHAITNFVGLVREINPSICSCTTHPSSSVRSWRERPKQRLSPLSTQSSRATLWLSSATVSRSISLDSGQSENGCWLPSTP